MIAQGLPHPPLPARQLQARLDQADGDGNHDEGAEGGRDGDKSPQSGARVHVAIPDRRHGHYDQPYAVEEVAQRALS